MDPLTDHQKQLAVEAISRAESIASRYSHVFPEYKDEFESSALWGVMRAASSFDPDKGGVWEDWSLMAIKGEIKNFLKSFHVKHSRPITQLSLEMLECEPGPDQEEELYRFAELMKLLSKKQRRICELIYLRGLGIEQASFLVGLSPRMGYRAFQSAINRLKKELAA